LRNTHESGEFPDASADPSLLDNFDSFTVKQSFSGLHSMSKDDMLKDGRKMSPMHVTLQAGVCDCKTVQKACSKKIPLITFTGFLLPISHINFAQDKAVLSEKKII